MNLVPFPSLHYIVSSQTPLYALADVRIPPRRLDQMFTDAFAPEYQLIKADPKHSLYLACALMVRGNVEVSDIRRNIERYSCQARPGSVAVVYPIATYTHPEAFDLGHLTPSGDPSCLDGFVYALSCSALVPMTD